MQYNSKTGKSAVKRIIMGSQKLVNPKGYWFHTVFLGTMYIALIEISNKVPIHLHPGLLLSIRIKTKYKIFSEWS